MMRRVGLFGGSFNPIHLGHLYLVNAARDALHLDAVILMPTGQAPHKDSSAYASAADRLEMCRLAIADKPWMTVSDLEINRPGKSYTVKTLRQLRKQYPDVAWTLLIGSDMLLTFEQWYCWQEILQMAHICVVSRETGDYEKLYAHAEALRETVPGAEIQVLTVQAFPISSTKIRENWQNNAEMACFLPPKVLQYIDEHRLYRKTEVTAVAELASKEELQGFTALLKARLSKKRFVHSMNVADSARELAHIWGADPDAAYLAGLLHDCCKELPIAEQEELIRSGPFEPSPMEWMCPPVLHGIAAASYMHAELGIEDAQVLSAARWHTVGHGAMTLLEEIVYLADLISADRNYHDVERFRKLARHDIHKAMLAALQYAIESVIKKGTPLPRSTVDAYNRYLLMQQKKTP